MNFGFCKSGKIIVILVARVTLTKTSCYHGQAWAAVENSFLQNRDAFALSWTDVGTRLLLRLLSTKVVPKGILESTMMQAMGIISWNKISRPLCSCTSLRNAHEWVVGRRWALSCPAEGVGHGSSSAPAVGLGSGWASTGEGNDLAYFPFN